MANSITAHTKQLRIAASRRSNDKAISEGRARRILMQLPTETADDFDAICAEMGLSRPQALKALCELYHQNQ